MSRRSVSVNITAYGLWQMKLGRKNLELEVDGGTLCGLIEDLARKDGKNFKDDILTTEGKLADGLRIFVNGVARNDMNAALQDGDDVVLVSLFDGG